MGQTSDFRAEREVIVRACQDLSRKGFLAGIGGNMAVRVSEDCFAVTPSAADYQTMLPEDICILEFGSLSRIHGSRQPSVESGLHAKLFSSRPDLKASIHTHQPIASAVALLAESICTADGEEREALGPEIRITPYGPSGTKLLVRAFARSMDTDINGYLLQSHGVITGASSMEQALRNVELIEEAATRHLRHFIRSPSTTPEALRQKALTVV